MIARCITAMSLCAGGGREPFTAAAAVAGSLVAAFAAAGVAAAGIDDIAGCGAALARSAQLDGDAGAAL